MCCHYAESLLLLVTKNSRAIVYPLLWGQEGTHKTASYQFFIVYNVDEL